MKLTKWRYKNKLNHVIHQKFVDLFSPPSYHLFNCFSLVFQPSQVSQPKTSLQSFTAIKPVLHQSKLQ